MSTLAERVHTATLGCLYATPPPPILPQPDTVVVEGLVRTYGFDPKRVEAQRAEIEALIDEIVPETFYVDGGGGMSFLSLAETKTGEHWGEHRDMEALYVLAAAIGRARFCMPRAVWAFLPGGVPYVQFDRKAQPG